MAKIAPILCKDLTCQKCGCKFDLLSAIGISLVCEACGKILLAEFWEVYENDIPNFPRLG